MTSSGAAEFNFPGAQGTDFCSQKATVLLHQTYTAGVLAVLLACYAALTGNLLPTLREDYRFHIQGISTKKNGQQVDALLFCYWGG